MKLMPRARTLLGALRVIRLTLMLLWVEVTKAMAPAL